MIEFIAHLLTRHFSVLHKGPIIYYVNTFLGFWTPLPPYVSMFFSNASKQKLSFSDTPLPYKLLRNTYMNGP